MKFSDVLLERKLLLIGNFILTSGKSSPYYIDLRKLPSYPEFNVIVNEAINIVKNIKFDIIVGIATGGIILASYLACKLNKPVGYVRVEKKGHGTDKLLEAEVEGKRVLVVDDVCTTGGSIEKAVKEIVNNGGRVVGALVIVDREEGARERLKNLGVELYALYKVSYILKEILNSNKLSEKEKNIIKEYFGEKVEK
ncbi:MAG: orotate phosphoribosyltransferase [Sulfolobaceae archaeon]